MNCFDDAQDGGMAVELTVNRCIDCSIMFTYLASADGALYEVLVEADFFGDERRETRVSRCEAIDLDPEDAYRGPQCRQPTGLLWCDAPLR